MIGGRGLIVGAGCAALLAFVFAAAPAATDAPKQIGATGTIEPFGGVVMVAGVPGSIIEGIPVQIGQRVKKGDLLMTLDDRDGRTDAGLAQIALQQARAHASQASAMEAVAVESDADRLARAQQDAAAYRALGPNATSLHQQAMVDATVEDARTALEIERRKQAQAGVDGAADVDAAAKRFSQAEAKLALYHLTAPSDGVVLQISQHANETLSGAPPVAIGDVSSMYVLCDAFQGDLLKIRPGMRATVTSNAFSGEMAGQVEWVGQLIQSKAQTGQFRIRLDDPALAARLVGLEVNVKVIP